MKTIGIIGGMGPMATVDLFEKIVAATEAGCDQEHIHILIDNNTDIPDRTAGILGKGPSPVPEMLASVRRLTESGADALIMGCNTAHYFLPELLPHMRVPFINMLEETARYCFRLGLHRVGLLASGGTYASGIYAKAFACMGMQIISPDAAGQKVCHDIICHGVKAGNAAYDASAFHSLLADMQRDGVESFILGCTEMPLAVRMYGAHGHFIDATQVLAEAAVRFAGAQCLSKLETPAREPGLHQAG